MENKTNWLERAVTTSVPNPADYPLGSPQSRAAARALLEARKRVAVDAEERYLFVLLNAGRELPDELCIQAIQEDCRPGFQAVESGVIPGFVTAKTEKLLLKHGWRKPDENGALPPTKTTQSTAPDVFTRMSQEELDEYAKTGELPDWAR
jgi:hypothetical protein